MPKLMQVKGERAGVIFEPHYGNRFVLEAFGSFQVFITSHNQQRPEWKSIKELGELLVMMADSHLEGGY